MKFLEDYGWVIATNRFPGFFGFTCIRPGRDGRLSVRWCQRGSLLPDVGRHAVRIPRGEEWNCVASINSEEELRTSATVTDIQGAPPFPEGLETPPPFREGLQEGASRAARGDRISEIASGNSRDSRQLPLPRACVFYLCYHANPAHPLPCWPTLCASCSRFA